MEAVEPLRVAAVRERLGETVGSDELIAAAVRAVVGGAPGAALERLAGLARTEEPDAHDVFEEVLVELDLPHAVPAFMAIEQAQLENEALHRLYFDVGDLADIAPDDPRLPALADKVVVFIEAMSADAADMAEQPVGEDLIAAAAHVTEQYANNRIESDHGRLKARLRPMRGLKRLRSAGAIAAGHAFVQNLRRGHYELATDTPPCLRLATAFTELAQAV